MFIPGKILYKKQAELRIRCLAGTMIDQQAWIPQDKHNYFGSLYSEPYRDMTVTIEFDDKVLFTGDLSQPVDFKYQFTDSDEKTTHYFKICLSGLNDNHRCYIKDIGDVAPMMQIDGIWIENLSMRLAMEDHGECKYENLSEMQAPSEYMGQNGYQKLEFSTPIYPWLLSIHSKPEYFY